MNLKIIVVVVGAVVVLGGCSTQPSLPSWSTPVDCLGNGSSCAGQLNATQANVRVTNNHTQTWRVHVTCAFGGDQYGPINQPAINIITSQASCLYDSPALYWNVLAF